MRISDWSSDVCSSDLIYRKPPRNYLSLLQYSQPASGFRRIWETGGERHGTRNQPTGAGSAVLSDFANPCRFDEKKLTMRSEERSVGKEGVSTCRSRWSAYH